MTSDSTKLSIKKRQVTKDKETQTEKGHKEQNVEVVSSIRKAPEMQQSQPVDFKLIERQRQFWKLARPKFAVINFLCPECRKINYKHPDQFKMKSDHEFHFTQVMCPTCVRHNMIQTDYYNKHTKNPH